MPSGHPTPQVPTSRGPDMLPESHTFPLIEGGTKLDLNALVAQHRADPYLRVLYNQSHNDKSDAGFFQWLDDKYEPKLRRTDTRIHGAPPISTDTSVRYTHVPSKYGHPSVTIRWWYGHQFGYNFDIINPESGQSVHPSGKLSVIFWEKGAWHKLPSLTGRKGGFNEHGPPRWCIEAGSRLRLLRDNGAVLGEVMAPYAPAEEHTQYEYFRELADALKHSA